MDNRYIQIEIDDNKLKEIFDRLSAAQETIYDCYRELIELGVVKIKNASEISKDNIADSISQIIASVKSPE